MRPSQIGLFGGGRNRSVVISADQTNYNLFTALGSPASPIDVVVTVNSGITVRSNSTATPAFDEGALPSGSRVRLINNGKIYGMGGAGGGSKAGTINVGGDVTYTGTNSAGGAGGDALKLTAPTTIVNASGEIFGGGGGGGSGTVVEIQDSAVYLLAGGGGGGGRGANTSSAGVSGLISGFYVDPSYQGTNGGTGSSSGAGSAGSGGTATTEGGPASGGAGGAGGDWATAGSNGGTFSSPYFTSTSGPTTGGAAGKAVDLNGQSITWVSGNDSTHVKGAVS